MSVFLNINLQPQIGIDVIYIWKKHWSNWLCPDGFSIEHMNAILSGCGFFTLEVLVVLGVNTVKRCVKILVALLFHRILRADEWLFIPT